MIITAIERQNMFDIALIGSGSAEDAYAIAYANGKSISDHINEGDSITVSSITNQRTVEYFKIQRPLPATCDITAEGIFDNTFDNTFE